MKSGKEIRHYCSRGGFPVCPSTSDIQLLQREDSQQRKQFVGCVQSCDEERRIDSVGHIIVFHEQGQKIRTHPELKAFCRKVSFHFPSNTVAVAAVFHLPTCD